jgi:hypothetical protein
MSVSAQATSVSLVGATQGTTDSSNQEPLPSPPAGLQSSNSPSNTNTTASQSSATPRITVHYSTGSGKAAVSVTLVSKTVPSTPDESQFITSTNLDPVQQAKEQFELTPRGIEQLPEIRPGLDVTVSGILHPRQLFMTFRIQIGSRTDSLQLIISGHESPSASAEPAIDQLYLVSSNGTVLAELSGAAALAQALQENMTVDLNGVPVGARLLARVVETSSQATTTAADASASSANQNIPFTLAVLRPNLSIGTSAIVPVFSAASAVPISGIVSAFLGLLSSTSFTTGESSLALKEPVTSTSESAEQLQTTDGTVLTSSASLTQVPTQVRAAVSGLSLGPLPSRGPTALGPRLGTTQEEELAPMVDRAERAFDLAMSGLDAGGSSDHHSGRGGNGGADAGLRNPGDDLGFVTDPSSPLVVVRNPGGLPMLTGALKIEPSGADRAAILASLAGETQAVAAELQRELPAEWRFQVIRPGTDQAEESVCTDFFTTACGLLLGIGLTSGPLYPDMMGFVRHWLPRRMRRAIRSRADAERLKRLS